MRFLPLPVILVIGVIGCGEESVGDPGRPGVAAVNRVTPLRVVESPTPPLRVPNYRTSGTYPQVASNRVELKPVNRALRNAVLRAQREYGELVRRTWGSSMPELFQPNYRYSGEYRTLRPLKLISASTVVVSVLVPIRRRAPGGTGGATWLSITVQVPSGAPVGIRDLFAEPSRGLQALATAVRKKVLSTNSCIQASFTDPVGAELNARGFAPTPRNYRYFALAPTGLAVGFPQDQVGGSSCSRVEATVPYAVVRRHLSPLGRKLVAGVRAPGRRG
jgi:hypothetical protein